MISEGSGFRNRTEIVAAWGQPADLQADGLVAGDAFDIVLTYKFPELDLHYWFYCDEEGAVIYSSRSRLPLTGDFTAPWELIPAQEEGVGDPCTCQAMEQALDNSYISLERENARGGTYLTWGHEARRKVRLTFCFSCGRAVQDARKGGLVHVEMAIRKLCAGQDADELARTLGSPVEEIVMERKWPEQLSAEANIPDWQRQRVFRLAPNEFLAIAKSETLFHGSGFNEFSTSPV